MSSVAIISVIYDPQRIVGRLETADTNTPIWSRLRARAIADSAGSRLTPNNFELPWPEVLAIIREFGTRQAQEFYNFRFAPLGEAVAKIQQFSKEVRRVRASREIILGNLSSEQISENLKVMGFKRVLKPFQLRDLAHLLALPHGANFSVPGAGKTTVAFALHLLCCQNLQHLFVVGPKACFPAWREIITECLDASVANAKLLQPFKILDGVFEDIQMALESGPTRFVMSYDQMIRNEDILTSYFARTSVHLILDESHRMKAGASSQRGAFLLKVANLPVRRDILTGTPMPQGPSDLASQLAFLWPGHGYDLQITRGASPKEALGELYVRTTKSELGLPPAFRHYYQVSMLPGQMALYAVVRNEELRQLLTAMKGPSSSVDFIGARRSVMRLLQLSVNPTLALKSMAPEFGRTNAGIVDQVLEEGPSSKLQAVADHARRLANSGQKVLVWTIFTDTILELERMLAELNPVTLYGGVPSGEASNPITREGRIKRFHKDSDCQLMIANPAAAGEGISLHTVCHNAIYVDRSYVTTHYLQSIDRIHRLGLDPDTETHIHIYQTKAPAGLGSIDLSVSRRLAMKVRNLQQLLSDPDLHQIALDEENAEDPIDYNVDLQDLVDLVEELEGRAANVDEPT